VLLILKNVVSSETLQEVRAILSDAEFADGRATAGTGARTVKHNLQVPAESDAAGRAGQIIVAALQADNRFVLGAWPHAIRMPLFSRYEPGMSYGEHLDNPIMLAGGRIRTDISVTVFLSSAADYDGGELVIHSDYGQQPVKGEAGDAVIYPSTLLHRVQPVTRGVRHVAVTWVQSMVRDPARRKILFDLAVLADQIARTPGRTEGSVIQKCHDNLLRMWAET
jgi:PKHD-type hydroxylase